MRRREQKASSFSNEYRRYLQSLHWTSLRSQLYQLRGRVCRVCNSSDRVEAHHLVYRRPLTCGCVEDLMALCHSCHEYYHANEHHIMRGLSKYATAARKRGRILHALSLHLKYSDLKPLPATPENAPPIHEIIKRTMQPKRFQCWADYQPLQKIAFTKPSDDARLSAKNYYLRKTNSSKQRAIEACSKYGQRY